jgi:signal transduction histidine kinase
VKSLGLDENSPAVVELDRRWRFRWAFGVSFALLIAIAAYGVVQNQRAAASRALLARSLEIQGAVLDLSHRGSLMELHQRGFLLTGDMQALRLRDAAAVTARAQVDRLLRWFAGQPEQVRQVQAFAAAFEQRHERMQVVSTIAMQHGLAAARAAFALRGQGSLEPMVAALDAVRADQERLLQVGTARADAEQKRFGWVLVYGTALAMLLLGLAALSLLAQFGRNRRLAKQLIQANQAQASKSAELERSNRELEAFSYTISHDLRAPLRHVDGYARMLQEDAGDQLTPEMQRYLDMISGSSRHMGQLIDDLLAFSRVGRKPLERITLDMGELVRRALHEAGAEHARATVDIGPLPAVDADPVLMRQAWVNLVSNAVKYSAPRGADARIEVSGERDGAVARYRIRDNGVGFDMRYADKLFGVFHRLHSQDEFEGTGVGLAIVRQILERHGGRVSADARLGEGATFTLELPATHGPTPATGSQP